MSSKILVMRNLPSTPIAIGGAGPEKKNTVQVWAKPGDQWDEPQSIGVYVQILAGTSNLEQVFLTVEQAEELAIGILYAKLYAETNGKPEINA